MKLKIFYLISSFSLMLSLGLHSSNSTFSVATSTPEINIGELSTLTDNPCETPCWFGLIPDKSTTEEAFNFIKNHFDNGGADFNSEVDPKTKYVLNGAYRFFIGPDYRPDRNAAMDSFIIVENGLVNYIKIFMNRAITIKTAVQYLGIPDYIFFSRTQLDYLTLIYLDKLIRIEFYSPINPPIDLCTSSTLEKTFLATTVTYYSKHSAYEPEWRSEGKIEINGYENGESQPRLLAHSTSYQEYSIDPKQFQKFVESKDDISCEKLFENLPEATAVPMPTIIPEITAAKP